jgi:hypothetical protein
MNHTPASLLRGGHICARLGSPEASVSQQERVVRALFAQASFAIVVSKAEGGRQRRRCEYSDVSTISSAVLHGVEPRAIFAFYRALDREWFAKITRRLYLPMVVRNPRTMFPGSRSTFDTVRRGVVADGYDLVVALSETNPLEYAIFISGNKSVHEIYRVLSVETRVPKKWAGCGGLPQI